MRFLLTRPEQDSEALKNRLTALDHDVVISPLMEITPLEHTKIGCNGYQALVFTSRNAVKVFTDLYGAPNILVLTVGDKTADAAKNAGFNAVKSAGGNVEKLASLIIGILSPKNGPLLYPSAKHVSKDLGDLIAKDNFYVNQIEIYEAVAKKTFSEDIIEALKSGSIDTIPFYSSRSALIFIEAIKNAGLSDRLKEITALTISHDVAETVSQERWKNILIADQPNENSLLELIKGRE